MAAACPYKAVFEPSPPPGADRLSKNQDIPRPFVFRAPPTQQTRYQAGEPFQFDLVLIGRALEYLPYFVLSFRELAREGLGLNRAPCTLQRVEQVGLPTNEEHPSDPETELIYSSENQVFRTSPSFSADQWIKVRLQGLSSAKPTLADTDRNGDPGVKRLSLRFLTPTHLRADGEVVRRPQFHHVFKRLRDRINALSTFFGDGPLAVDFRGLGERAEKVRTISAQTEWVERFRTSSKTHQRHELSGFVGECIYDFSPVNSEPPTAHGLSEFLPWLALGELVHVGKHVAWGNGRYVLWLD